jgi:hypothetical protein
MKPASMSKSQMKKHLGDDIGDSKPNKEIMPDNEDEDFSYEEAKRMLRLIKSFENTAVKLK